MKKKTLKLTSIAILFSLICGTLIGADKMKDNRYDSKGSYNQSQKGKMHTYSSDMQKQHKSGEYYKTDMIKANEFIGMDVRNRVNDELGSIEDVIIDDASEKIKFAVVSYGGTLGWGDKLAAVPVSQFSIEERDGDKYAVLDKPRQDFQKNAPTVSLDGDIQGEMSNICDEVKDYYDIDMKKDKDYNRNRYNKDREYRDREDRDSDYRNREREDFPEHKDKPENYTRDEYPAARNMDRYPDRNNRDDNMYMRSDDYREEGYDRDNEYRGYKKLTDVIGMTVQNMQRDDVGEIEDVIIDINEGDIVYGLVSFGGFMEIGQDYALVPWSSFSIYDDQHVAIADVSTDQLEKVAFGRNEFPDLSDRQYNRKVYSEFNQRPYWVRNGYMSMDMEKKDASKCCWKNGSDYNECFKNGSQKSYTGTVESIGSYSISDHAEKGLRLKVDSKDKEQITVYAGPKSYARNEKLNFHYGDKVELKGCWTKVGDKKVFMAATIKKNDGKELKLYDSKGEPQWEVEEMYKDDEKKDMKKDEYNEEDMSKEKMNKAGSR